MIINIVHNLSKSKKKKEYYEKKRSKEKRILRRKKKKKAYGPSRYKDVFEERKEQKREY